MFHAVATLSQHKLSGKCIQTETMPRSNKPGWIDWLKCETKQIILEDLASGLIPLDADPEKAWENWHSKLPVVQIERAVEDQFVERFKGHVKQMTKKKKKSMKDLEDFRRHRELHPIKKRNERGKLIFEQHPACKRLAKDVKKGNHKRMTPAELCEKRSVHHIDFSLDEFRPRICQEVRRQKFIRCLNDKREQKQEKRQALLTKPKETDEESEEDEDEDEEEDSDSEMDEEKDSDSSSEEDDSEEEESEEDD